MEYYDRLVDFLTWRAWSIIKFVKHVCTGQSELERISASSLNASDVQLLVAIDQSLRNSHQLCALLAPIYGKICQPRSRSFVQIFTQSSNQCEIQRIERSDIEEETKRIVTQIAQLKQLACKPSAQITIQALTRSITNTLAINALSFELDALAKTRYDATNHQHEAQLMQLWSLLMPNKTLTQANKQSVVSPDWDEIGFQGENPATDFRGAGILGLTNLIEFAKNCKVDSQNVLRDAKAGGLAWFSFAITGLNLTFDLMRLTREHALDRYYFKYGASIDSFNALYSVVFVRFNQTWRRHQPKSVMEFAHIRGLFLKELRQLAQFAHLDDYEHLQPLGDFYDRLEPKRSASQTDSEAAPLLSR